MQSLLQRTGYDICLGALGNFVLGLKFHFSGIEGPRSHRAHRLELNFNDVASGASKREIYIYRERESFSVSCDLFIRLSPLSLSLSLWFSVSECL